MRQSGRKAFIKLYSRSVNKNQAFYYVDSIFIFYYWYFPDFFSSSSAITLLKNLQSVAVEQLNPKSVLESSFNIQKGSLFQI